MQRPLLFAAFLLLITRGTVAQCPAILNCPQGSPVICDLTGNDALFWNDAPYTWSLLNETADLYEGSVDLGIKILVCAGGTLNVSYTLFLDLDNDNLLETVVSSNAFPPPGIVFANNAFNPGYTGGDPVVFDKRSLADSLKFRFELEINASDDTVFAALRWNAAGLNVLPRLPEGKHRLVWRVEQDAKVKYCEHSFRVKDCLEPLLTCLADPLFAIAPDGKVAIAASDVLESVEDNTTPDHLLQLSLRKSGEGSGFPLHNGFPVTHLDFDCTTPGSQSVELWAKDKAGNVSFCQTTIFITDPEGYCQVLPQICARPFWSDTGTVADTKFKVLWVDTAQILYSALLPALPGNCAELDATPPANAFSIVAEKDTNHLNGVSTFDLVLISRHILGTEPFNAPWKWIAADANSSESVTSFDVVELRKLILGIYDKLPANTSWRFFAADCEFPANPFSGYCPSGYSFAAMPPWNYPEHLLFNALKTGDVNGTANPAAFGSGDAGSRGEPLRILLPDLTLAAGEHAEVSLQLADAGAWLGLQAGLLFDTEMVETEAVIPGALPGFDENSINREKSGAINVSWSGAEPLAIFPGDNLLTIRLKALRPVKLREAFRFADGALRAEIYQSDKTIRPLQLDFSAVTTSSAGTTVILTPQPNPTQQGAAIPIRLARAETVFVELADAAGKTVFQEIISLQSGAAMLELPAHAFPRPGVYAWRVKAGEVFQAGKMIRL